MEETGKLLSEYGFKDFLTHHALALRDKTVNTNKMADALGFDCDETAIIVSKSGILCATCHSCMNNVLHFSRENLETFRKSTYNKSRTWWSPA